MSTAPEKYRAGHSRVFGDSKRVRTAFKRWRLEAERLCEQIGRDDLQGRKVEIRLGSEVGLQPGASCRGFASIDADRWWPLRKGREHELRPVSFVVGDSVINRESQSTPRSVLLGKWKREQFFGNVIHEFSHCLEDLPPLMEPQPVTVEAAEIKQNVIDRFNSGEASERPESEEATPPWSWPCNHDFRFIRTALHLMQRACDSGCEAFVDAFLASIAAGPKYELSPLFLYWAALRDELFDNPSGSIIDLTQREPPDRFKKVWTDDVVSWVRKNRID